MSSIRINAVVWLQQSFRFKNSKFYKVSAQNVILKTYLQWINIILRKVKIYYSFKRIQLRSSRPEVFCKKGVLRNFAKFTWNTCARVSFLITLQAATLLKKRTWHRFVSANFPKFQRTPFLTEHLRWLISSVIKTELGW